MVPVCYCGKCLNFYLLYDCEVSVSPASGLRGLSECSCQREVSNIIIANLDETKFKFNTNEIFNEISKWFHSNLLMLNYDKTYFLQFLTKTDYEINLKYRLVTEKLLLLKV
jgi:hypothetical protein